MKAILVLAVLVIAYFVLRTEYRRSPSQFTRRFFYLSIAILIAVIAALVLTGRLHWFFALIAAAIPLVSKTASLARYFPMLLSLKSFFSKRGSAASAATEMTRDEALQILGLSGSPSRDEIIEAYKSLIQKNHPDKGGNSYLAAKLNEAKQKLLNDSG